MNLKNASQNTTYNVAYKIGSSLDTGKGYSQIKDSLPEGIEVACHNSADSCTLTGPVDLVNKFVEKLKKEGIFARSVNVSNIAYHSKHIVPAAPMLQKRLKEVGKHYLRNLLQVSNLARLNLIVQAQSSDLRVGITRIGSRSGKYNLLIRCLNA